MTVLEHPGALRPLFWRASGAMAALSGLQLCWAIGILYVSIKPPAALQDWIPPRFDPGIVYAIYSGVHGLYTLIGIGFSILLRSRAWMRAAAFATAVPGPGVLFGLFQVPLGIVLFRRLNHSRWEHFFRWQEGLQKQHRTQE